MTPHTHTPEEERAVVPQDGPSCYICEITRLLSTLESCRAELAEFKSALPGLNAPFIFEAGVARSRAEAAEAKVARLAEALKRVPCVWHPNTDLCRDGQTCFRCLTLRETEGGAK